MALPASVPVDGTRRVLFVSAIAAPAAMTLTEATAGENVSCYLTGDGWQPSGDQATVTDTRLCSTQDFERPGRKTKSLTIRYVYNLNTPADDEARLALGEGEVGYLVNILQKPEEDGQAPEVGDWYEAWPVQMGEPMVLPGEAGAVDRIEQRAFVTGPVEKFAKIVAGA